MDMDLDAIHDDVRVGEADVEISEVPGIDNPGSTCETSSHQFVKRSYAYQYFKLENRNDYNLISELER